MEEKVVDIEFDKAVEQEREPETQEQETMDTETRHALNEYLGELHFDDGVNGRLQLQRTWNIWQEKCPDYGEFLLYWNSIKNEKKERLKSATKAFRDSTWNDPAWNNYPSRPKKGKASGEIVEEYNYCDLKGNLLFQTVKFEPKDFRQRHRDSNGEWVWNLDGIKRVPYRLPELMGGDDPVFIVEGEKDVETLRSQGLTATTNPMGALKWTPDLSPFFFNRKVIILPDNDEPGREHARRVAQSLQGITKSVKIVELSGLEHKGDVSDYLKNHTVPEMLELIVNAPEKDIESEFVLHPVKMVEVSYPPLQPIVKGFPLYEGLEYLISGEQGNYKSVVSMHMGKCITTGEPLFGKYPILRQGPVFLFDEENPQSIMEDRRHGFGFDKGDLPFYLFHFSGVQVDDKDGRWIREILRWVEKIKPVFVIFDSFIDFHTQEENAPVKMQGVMKLFRKISNTGPATWLICHVSKEAKLTRGTTAIPAACDMEFTAQANTDGEILLDVRKNRIAPFTPIIITPHFEPGNYHVTYKQTKDEELWDVVGRILRDAGTPLALDGILEECKKLKVITSYSTLRRVVLDRKKSNLVQPVDMTVTKPDKNDKMRTYTVHHYTVK